MESGHKGSRITGSGQGNNEEWVQTGPRGYGLELEGKEQISGALELRWGCIGRGPVGRDLTRTSWEGPGINQARRLEHEMEQGNGNWTWLVTDSKDWGGELKWKLVWQGWEKGMGQTIWSGRRAWREWVRLQQTKGRTCSSMLTARLPTQGRSTGQASNPYYLLLLTSEVFQKCLLPCSYFTSKLTTGYCYQLLH